MKLLLKSSKFKILSATLALAVLLVIVIRGSVAFFTDAKESSSVFTAGNVYIELSEAAVVPDSSGNLIEDTSADRIIGADITASGASVVHSYGIVFPGQKIFKDPTIKNTGSSEAWVAAKIIIEDGVGDIHRLYRYDEFSDDIDIERLLTGGLLDETVHVGDWNGIPDVCFNDNYAMVQISSHSQGRYEFYFFMLNPLEKDGTVEIFDTLFINEFFGNTEMVEFRELKLTVQAFAVQTKGFASCLEAMKGAFDGHF